ncbi:hypothetical protein [Enterobacter sp. 22466]|uniref:hypothetical protein n=1 Tax=Enterobacter sp. 22466 TaxID=3453924 RepID=UPI003F868E1C
MFRKLEILLYTLAVILLPVGAAYYGVTHPAASAIDGFWEGRKLITTAEGNVNLVTTIYIKNSQISGSAVLYDGKGTMLRHIDETWRLINSNHTGSIFIHHYQYSPQKNFPGLDDLFQSVKLVKMRVYLIGNDKLFIHFFTGSPMGYNMVFHRL